jgi:hypothetical protein
MKQTKIIDFEGVDDVEVFQITRAKPKYRMKIDQGQKNLRMIKCRVCGEDVIVVKGTLAYNNRLCLKHQHLHWDEIERLRKERLIKEGYKFNVKLGIWEKPEKNTGGE